MIVLDGWCGFLMWFSILWFLWWKIEVNISKRASGERLVSAARDGDLQEAKALLDYNPRLARYSTFGVRNSPLHYSAAQGHHEIVSLLLESGVDINLRNYRGQTALMQACQYGHWEVVQNLMLFRANVHKTDYLNGGTALHFAALNGHTRCIRLLLVDYVPSIPNFWDLIRRRSSQQNPVVGFEMGALLRIINKPADGGITALHMAALNGHVESTHLLLDFGASVSDVTVEDGTTIDLIGAGSTPLHYAACGGNVQCCQVLIARGASLTAKNANGWTPLMVARSWHRHWLEGILNKKPEARRVLPSSYLSLPLMSVVKIARDCGWRNSDVQPSCFDPCVVCLERKCTVAAEGCGHEFCTRCALYLCSTNSTSAVKTDPPGSIACPLCRKGIFSFVKLPGTHPIKEIPRTSLSLSLCTACSSESSDSVSISASLCKPDFHCAQLSPSTRCSLRTFGCQKLPTMKFNASLCLGGSKAEPSFVPHGEHDQRVRNQLRCLRASLRRSVSESDTKTSCFPFVNP
ncbi:probable E3 ubiquitin-protein ligase XBOS32 isoform X2 [Aristolochia californica]|uniref:probable E3 ubiquitin-protein ligase XBOS32 isoform X2 n=1 Tax=Aristolochia californica TaxID=171875 RepID=UPI0035D80B89